MTIPGKDEIIKTFKWSEKQKTVGAVFGKGVGFWSEKENFKFGYHIGSDELDWIQYLESLDIWVVIQYLAGRVFQFSIKSQKCSEEFVNKKLSKSIVEHRPRHFLEIKYATLLGIVLENEISFIHFKKKQVISRITLSNKIRNLCFSDSYQLLFICSFSNSISVFQLNSCFCDFEEKPSKIQAKRFMSYCTYKPNTETLITCDEEKRIRLWNIKLMQCYQYFSVDTVVSALITTTSNLIVGCKHLSHYCFESQKAQLRETITCIASSKQWIFISSGNTLKYYSWRDGKMGRVVEGVFKKGEDIIHIEVDNNKGEVILMGESGSLQKRVIASSEIFLNVPKIPVSSTYKFDQNNSTLFQAQTNKFVISFITPQMAESRIINNEIKLFAFDSFAGVLAIYYQSHVYVIKYSSMTLTHWIQLPHNYQLMDLSFIQGTNSLVLYSKYKLDMVILQQQGKCSHYHRVEYGIPIGDSPLAFSSPQLVFEGKIITKCHIYTGTEKGGIDKTTIKGLNIPLCQAQLVETNESLKYKEILTTVGTMTFHYNYNKLSLEKLKKREVESQRVSVQTNLKAIRSLMIGDRILASNVTRVIVFDKSLELLGELDIEASYPIKWFPAQSKKGNKDYADKILDHLGHPREKLDFEPTHKPKSKSYVTKQQFEDHRATHQNLFKTKTKTRAFQKDTETFLIESKTMQSLVQKARLNTITEPSAEQKVFSRQRMVSERLLGKLSKTIESREKIEGVKLNFNLGSKQKSAMEFISSLDLKLKTSRLGRRMMTEPEHRLPSISSRQKL